jgi:hypothetical protein
MYFYYHTHKKLCSHVGLNTSAMCAILTRMRLMWCCGTGARMFSDGDPSSYRRE